MVTNDDLSQFLMRQLIGLQKVIIEEMAEGSMTDIMKQRGDAQEFFNIMDGRDLLKLSREKRIEMASEAACHVHRAERVDEPAVLGRWVDPSGTLELEDIA